MWARRAARRHRRVHRAGRRRCADTVRAPAPRLSPRIVLPVHRTLCRELNVQRGWGANCRAGAGRRNPNDDDAERAHAQCQTQLQAKCAPFLIGIAPVSHLCTLVVEAWWRAEWLCARARSPAQPRLREAAAELTGGAARVAARAAARAFARWRKCARKTVLIARAWRARGH